MPFACKIPHVKASPQRGIINVKGYLSIIVFLIFIYKKGFEV